MHFLEKSKSRVVEFRAVIAITLHSYREERGAKSGTTGAELFVWRIFVRRDGYRVQQRRGDSLVRQRLTDASKRIIEPVARSEAIRNGVDTKYLTIFYVSEQPMLLIVLGKRSSDDVAGVRQGAVLEKKAAAADGDNHALKEGKELLGGRSLAGHLRDGDHVLVCNRSAVLPRLRLHTSVFGKACVVDPGIVEWFIYCAVMEVMDKAARRCELALSNGSGDCEAIQWRVLLRHWK